MVKTPKTRHSKPHRDPVTIELEPDAVSRVSETKSEPAADTASLEENAANTSGEAATSGPEQPDPSGYEFSTDGATSKSEDPEPEPAREQAQATPNAEPRRNNGVSMLVAGVAGGLIALAGAGALQFAGILPSGGSRDTQSLEPMQTEITQMRQELATLRSDAGGGDTELEGRVDTLGQSVEQAKADLAQLQQAASSADSNASGMETLNNRIDEIEKSIAALRQQDSQAETVDIEAIDQRIAEAAALAKTASDAITAANNRVAALEQSVGSLSSTVQAQADQPKVALAIAVSALKSAVERGGPFQAELNTFAAIAPDAPEIAALRPHAENGVASMDDLVAESDTAVKAMIAAARPVDTQAGFFDRLMTSAESLVTVRPIGAVEGTGIPETAARMEFAVKAGNLEKALAEYDSLPETVRTAGSTFAEKMRKRLEVKKLVDQAIADAMKA